MYKKFRKNKIQTLISTHASRATFFDRKLNTVGL